jgi:hypothetical protein
MTPAEDDLRRIDEQPAPRRAWTDRAFLQLVLARLREFYREPEAVFWTYGFPILLIVGLGIAFRNRPVEQMTVDLESGSESAAAASTLESNPRFIVTTGDAAQCAMRLRTGKTQLVVSATPLTTPSSARPDASIDSRRRTRRRASQAGVMSIF